MPHGNFGRDYEPSVYELVSLVKAAEVCGLSSDHLGYLAKRGELWAIKPARDWLTTIAAVKEYKARDIKPGRKPQNR